MITKQTNINKALAQELIHEPLQYRVAEEDYDVVHRYIAITKKYPSTYAITGGYLYHEVIDTIKHEFKDKCVLDFEYSDDAHYMFSVYRLVVDDQIILIKPRRTYKVDEHDFKFTKKQKKYGIENEYTISPGIDFIYDVRAGLPPGIVKIFSNLILDENVDHNSINLVCKSRDHVLYAKEYPLVNADRFDFDLDLHYGAGFEHFHNINIKRIDNSDKGIVLLHGLPGTGKSFYIRRLMRDLARRSKKILYLPNNMIEILGTPEFNNFLIDWTDGNNVTDGIIIVIEDAERVLIKRENNQYGADGVANILNSTDGILNDFFGIQVIATFNTDIKNIDDAILRKQRAISIREFKELTIEEARTLAEYLGIKAEINNPMSLADVYSLKHELDDKILLGDIEQPKKKKIGF